MAFLRGLLQGMEQTGLQALRRVVCDVEVGRYLVRAVKADSRDVRRERIGVLPQHGDGRVAVALKNSNGLRGAHAMTLQEDHDGLHRFLFGPGLTNLLRALFANPFHLAKAGGFLVDYPKGLHAEGFDEAFGVNFSDSLDQARAEILLDSLDGSGEHRFVIFRPHLTAEFLIVDPVSANSNGLAGGNGHEVADEGDEIGRVGDTKAGHEKAVLRIFVDDAFDDAFELSALGSLGGRFLH